MSSIIEKTYNLLDVLDSSDLIQKLTKSKQKLEKDEDILSLIKQINNELNNDKKIELKKELYSNKNYKDYIESYNELSYIILKINNQYKKYTNTKGCKQCI